MTRVTTALQRVLRYLFARADALMNRLYGWRLNPLYHSGALVAALLIVLLVTGLYLLIFYRIGAPYASVAAITDQVWVGRWVRALHRYASDAAVVAAAFHALRLFAQGRSWGPRTLAWVSGLILLFVVLVCGWTGYVMVWDVQGQVLAQEGARLLDLIPIFSEPITRGFVGERPLPNAFFFLNLFLHVALPIGLGFILWVHVSRVARPALLPPPALTWGAVALLVLLSVAWPVAMAPPADLFRIPGSAPFDAFYSFWLPLARAVGPAGTWVVALAIGTALLAVPLWTRPPQALRPPPSLVDERLCSGCEQCWLDCPYEAIAMVERQDGREGLVARVTPALCVSCGICAGSCAPMGVGPAGRTGRAQLSMARAFASECRPQAGDVVVIACDRGAGGVAADQRFDGALVYPVSCTGSLHTSVIEYFLRAGGGAVLVAACPPRDCWHREGPKWLEQRMYHDREAELHERVDRRRVRLVWASAGEREVVGWALARFRVDLTALAAAEASGENGLERECEISIGDRKP